MSNWDLEIEAAASEGDKMDETVIAQPDESLQLEDLKFLEKAKAKSAFTKTRHSLLQILEEDFPDREEIKVIQEKMINAEEKAMDIMGNLYDKYKHRNDIQNVAENDLKCAVEKIVSYKVRRFGIWEFDDNVIPIALLYPYHITNECLLITTF
ncbi:Hypothetical predicted protein [Mytilus galloprovincialis]|uniref:Uncharacterized protein n=1 Tax=Mytilus galloprovincialis TaxID=29158 RepID=A0A8B6BQP9_MYTGA|nr:Hypothetical predicted protein [Mytilus galloprovincialis]